MAKDLEKTNTADLEKTLAEKRVELQSFRFGIAGSRTKNVKAGRDLKRTSRASIPSSPNAPPLRPTNNPRS